MKRIMLILIGVLSLLSSRTFAQGTTLTRDLESWLSVGGQKKYLDKKLTAEADLQFRLDNNSSRLAQYFVTLNGDYEIAKNFKLGLGYRFVRDRKGDFGFKTEHRINIDASYSKKINRLKVGSRLRFQKKTNGLHSDYPTTKYRLRLKFNYNIPKWKFDPFLSTELYYSKENLSYNYVDGATDENPVSGFQKYRIQLGTSRKLGKGEMKVFYMLEHQFSDYGTNFGIPINWNIIGANYTFKF
tara:strand:- start:247 stop:972 length:726 start_codon:yes stop_codon:yes gene_type:complete